MMSNKFLTLFYILLASLNMAPRYNSNCEGEFQMNRRKRTEILIRGNKELAEN